MRDIDLGPLEHGPHANLIHAMASRCFADESIQAIWVGGSLAAGRGDAYSDVDFRIAIEPGQIDRWTGPDWEQYLPLRPCAGLLLRFGEQAMLHHLVLTDGTIVDFYVQDRHARILNRTWSSLPVVTRSLERCWQALRALPLRWPERLMARRSDSSLLITGSRHTSK